MQQTEKYKLNLIESSDPFLPEGLNANTQKVEDVLAAREALSDEKLAEMDSRVTVLEGHKLAFGTYKGEVYAHVTQAQTIHVGFDPAAVFLQGGNTSLFLAWREMDYSSPYSTFSFVKGGFEVRSIANSASLNAKDSTYIYLALA